MPLHHKVVMVCSTQVTCVYILARKKLIIVEDRDPLRTGCCNADVYPHIDKGVGNEMNF